MSDRSRHVRSGKKASGVVLLLSLLVMASLVVSAAGMSSLILNSLQQTRVVDNALVAYYAAESGIEQALYEFRKDGVLPEDITTPESMTNGATYTRDVTGTEPVIYLTIPQDSTAEIALYDPDQPISETGIDSVRIWWNDDCSGCSVLHSTLVGWLPQSITGFDNVTNNYPWNPSSPTAGISLGGQNQLYRLRLRADNATMKDVEVRAYDASNNDIDLPGRVRIDAHGSYVDTEQRVTVTLPRQVPLSGVYDFVVFSECSLVKGGPISCP